MGTYFLLITRWFLLISSEAVAHIADQFDQNQDGRESQSRLSIALHGRRHAQYFFNRGQAGRHFLCPRKPQSA